MTLASGSLTSKNASCDSSAKGPKSNSFLEKEFLHQGCVLLRRECSRKNLFSLEEKRPRKLEELELLIFKDCNALFLLQYPFTTKNFISNVIQTRISILDIRTFEKKLIKYLKHILNMRRLPFVRFFSNRF